MQPNTSEFRILVAQDVLDAIDMGLYVAEQDSSYIESKVTNVKTLGDVLAFLSPKDPCCVCAVGAGILSVLRQGCDYNSPADLNQRSNINHLEALSVFDRIREVFSIKQLKLIEIAFEGCTYLGNYSPTDITLVGREASLAFREKHCLNDDFRNRIPLLRAIWQNILDNHGEFMP